MGNRTDELQELLAPAVADLGLELLGVEWHPAAEHSLLRLYIDVAPGGDGVEEGPRGVTVEDCEAVRLRCAFSDATLVLMVEAIFCTPVKKS